MHFVTKVFFDQQVECFFLHNLLCVSYKRVGMEVIDFK